MKSNTKYILIITAVVVAVVAIIGKQVIHRKEIVKKCPDLKNYTTELVDCYEDIVITGKSDASHPNKYYVQNYRMNLSIAGINNKDDYKYSDGLVYVIDKSPHDSTSTYNGITKYTVATYQDGKSQQLEYDKQEDIPNYVSINVTNNEIRRYKTINDIPENERSIFQSIVD